MDKKITKTADPDSHSNNGQKNKQKQQILTAILTMDKKTADRDSHSNNASIVDQSSEMSVIPDHLPVQV